MKIEVTNTWFSFCNDDRHQFTSDKKELSCQCGEHVYGDAVKILDKINFNLKRIENEKVINSN